MTTQIIITRNGNNRTLTAMLLQCQSMRNGGHACYRWSNAVDDGRPAANRLGWGSAPDKEYMTVWQAIKAATVSGWAITL
jgi:hypothetical protein